MNEEKQFIFVVCQIKANQLAKSELASQLPDSRLAFSRPGFLTFRVADACQAAKQLKSTFARTMGISLSGVRLETRSELVNHVMKQVAEHSPEQIHVFSRDQYMPGHRLTATTRFEPGETEQDQSLVSSLGDALLSVAPTRELTSDRF